MSFRVRVALFAACSLVQDWPLKENTVFFPSAISRWFAFSTIHCAASPGRRLVHFHDLNLSLYCFWLPESAQAPYIVVVSLRWAEVVFLLHVFHHSRQAFVLYHVELMQSIPVFFPVLITESSPRVCRLTLGTDRRWTPSPSRLNLHRVMWTGIRY